MKVLFAGCGDIGVRAIRMLSNSSIKNLYQALAMRRNTKVLPENIDMIKGDLCNREDLLNILDTSHIDVIVVTLTPDHMSDQGYLNSYVAGARALKFAFKKTTHTPRLIIWISSSGVYGQTNGEWVDEISEVSPQSYRGKRLLEAEQIIQSLSDEMLLHEKGSIKTVVIRFSGIYGPGRGRLLSKIKQGVIAPKEPRYWTNRIHSEDCAGIIIHFLELYAQTKHLANLYLATDDEPTPAHEVQSWLAKEMKVDFLENHNKQNDKLNTVANRRCSNKLLKKSGYRFIFPNFREGYRFLL